MLIKIKIADKNELIFYETTYIREQVILHVDYCGFDKQMFTINKHFSSSVIFVIISIEANYNNYCFCSQLTSHTETIHTTHKHTF